MKDDIVFAMYKDKPTNGKNEFKKLVKKYKNQINIDDVYLRIVNYQVEKYGGTLDNKEGLLNYFQKQNINGNSSRRKKLIEHKKGCRE